MSDKDVKRINTELARKVRDQILLEPDSHRQDVWAEETDCGTTACVAGWACIIAGKADLYWDSEGDANIWRAPIAPESFGSYRRWAVTAEEVLGIDRYIDPTTGEPWDPELLGNGRSSDLFNSSNTHKGMLAALDRIIRAGEEQDA